MCDTVEFFLYQIKFLQVKLKDFLIQVVTDIITILTQKASTSILAVI